MMNDVNYKLLSIEDACQRLLKATHPVIVMHCRPDGDTLGSAVALAKIFGKMNKRAICICADKLPKRLEFMCDGFFTENYTITTTNTVIAVDIASPMQLGGLREGLNISLTIDHHDMNTPFSDNCTVPSAAACGEVIFEIAKRLIEMGKIDAIDADIAKSLYAAISSDTGCFKYSNVTPKTHRIAAELLEYGVKGDEINHKLFDCKDIKQLRAEAMALKNMELYENGRVAISTVTHKEKEEAGIESEYFETAIDIVRSVMGVEIAATIKENSKGKFKASIRSTSKNVAEIAAKLGGGGHIRAAGCMIEAESMDEAKDKLLSLILE